MAGGSVQFNVTANVNTLMALFAVISYWRGERWTLGTRGGAVGGSAVVAVPSPGCAVLCCAALPIRSPLHRVAVTKRPLALHHTSEQAARPPPPDPRGPSHAAHVLCWHPSAVRRRGRHA